MATQHRTANDRLRDHIARRIRKTRIGTKIKTIDMAVYLKRFGGHYSPNTRIVGHLMAGDERLKKVDDGLWERIPTCKK
jgi:hypothetical protein